jgi:hypothetical protein
LATPITIKQVFARELTTIRTTQKLYNKVVISSVEYQQQQQQQKIVLSFLRCFLKSKSLNSLNAIFRDLSKNNVIIIIVLLLMHQTVVKLKIN